MTTKQKIQGKSVGQNHQGCSHFTRTCRMVLFLSSIDIYKCWKFWQALAYLPQQKINFHSDLFTHFDERDKKFTSIA